MNSEERGQLKTGILASVVAAIAFIYLLDPLLRSLGSSLLRASGVIATRYQDRVFAELATGTQDFAFFIIWISGAAVLGAIAGLASRRLYRRFQRNTERAAASSSHPARTSIRIVLGLVIAVGIGWFLLDSYVPTPAKVDSRSDRIRTAIGAKRRSGDPQVKVSAFEAVKSSFLSWFGA